MPLASPQSKLPGSPSEHAGMMANQPGEIKSVDEPELKTSNVSAPKTSNHGPTNNIIVKYLPHTFDDDQLYELFAQFGNVISHRLIKNKDTGASLGYGFVRFDDDAAAMKACETLHETLIDDKMIKVILARPPVQYTESVKSNVYIAGLPKSLDREALDQLFSPYGKIVESRILSDISSDASNPNVRGVAFVRYATAECAAAAIGALHGSDMFAPLPPLVVKYARDTSSRKPPLLLHQHHTHTIVPISDGYAGFQATPYAYGYPYPLPYYQPAQPPVPVVMDPGYSGASFPPSPASHALSMPMPMSMALALTPSSLSASAASASASASASDSHAQSQSLSLSRSHSVNMHMNLMAANSGASGGGGGSGYGASGGGVGVGGGNASSATLIPMSLPHSSYSNNMGNNNGPNNNNNNSRSLNQSNSNHSSPPHHNTNNSLSQLNMGMNMNALTQTLSQMSLNAQQHNIINSLNNNNSNFIINHNQGVNNNTGMGMVNHGGMSGQNTVGMHMNMNSHSHSHPNSLPPSRPRSQTHSRSHSRNNSTLSNININMAMGAMGGNPNHNHNQHNSSNTNNQHHNKMGSMPVMYPSSSPSSSVPSSPGDNHNNHGNNTDLVLAVRKPVVRPGVCLFVFHLPGDFTESQLFSLFSDAGTVFSVKIVHDSHTRQSKGYGFVNMQSFEEAQMAINQFNGLRLGAKFIKVSFKQARGM